MRETRILAEEIFSSADEKQRREFLLDRLRQFLKAEGANPDKAAV